MVRNPRFSHRSTSRSEPFDNDLIKLFRSVWFGSRTSVSNQEERRASSMRTTERLKFRVRARQRSRTLSTIETAGLTTFAGVVLALLIFMMLATGSPLHPPIRPVVDLSYGNHLVSLPGAVRDDAVIVAVQRDGAIFLNGHWSTPDKLPDEIRERLKGGAERRAYVWADAHAKYSDVETTIDAIRSAGIANVTLVANQRRP